MYLESRRCTMTSVCGLPMTTRDPSVLAIISQWPVSLTRFVIFAEVLYTVSCKSFAGLT
jgi:hypothetical protein